MLIFCSVVCIGDPNTGKNPSFVNIQATTIFTEDFKHQIPPIISESQVQQGRVIRRNRVNFGRDKFTGYGFAPFIDALTDDRHYIEMRGCRYTAPPLTSSGSVVRWGPV
ncbi:hypothetical protein TEHSL10_23440 [Tetragenococcus halophilus]|nr:hypothetical protein TEHSL10_23440 [Tetragenococcus halophilus]